LELPISAKLVVYYRKYVVSLMCLKFRYSFYGFFHAFYKPLQVFMQNLIKKPGPGKKKWSPDKNLAPARPPEAKILSGILFFPQGRVF